MKLSKLKSPPVPAVYEKNGEQLNMMVEADMLTPQFMEEMSKIAEVGSDKDASLTSQAAQFKFFVEVLSRVILTWDLEDDGKPVPVSVGVLNGLPIVVLTDLFEVCTQAGMPKKTTEQQSEDTTSPVAS